jgi:hypothetical protein
MNVKRRTLFFTTLAAVTAVAQAVLAAGASAPDFSGYFGRNSFNFEPLPNGPQPVSNMSRMRDGTSNIGQLVGDYKNPILKPEAAETIRHLGEMSKSGHTYPDSSNQCRPYNPPFNLAMELGIEILQKKDGITMIYDQDDQVRNIRLNSSHPAHVTPTPMGDSIGHYEGDELVVDTIGMNDKSLVDNYQTPHTDQIHVVERFKLVDGGRTLQAAVTVEDPGAFNSTWSAVQRWRRGQVRPLEEDNCAENNFGFLSYVVVPIPQADKPDF